MKSAMKQHTTLSKKAPPPTLPQKSVCLPYIVRKRAECAWKFENLGGVNSKREGKKKTIILRRFSPVIFQLCSHYTTTTTTTTTRRKEKQQEEGHARKKMDTFLHITTTLATATATHAEEERDRKT